MCYPAILTFKEKVIIVLAAIDRAHASSPSAVVDMVQNLILVLISVLFINMQGLRYRIVNCCKL
jgi:hypothetical protein